QRLPAKVCLLKAAARKVNVSLCFDIWWAVELEVNGLVSSRLLGVDPTRGNEFGNRTSKHPAIERRKLGQPRPGKQAFSQFKPWRKLDEPVQKPCVDAERGVEEEFYRK